MSTTVNFPESIRHEYRAPKHTLQHCSLKGMGIKVYVIDTNPAPTFGMSGIYVSPEIKGREQMEALRELLSAAITLADCIVTRRYENIGSAERMDPLNVRLDRQ